jgi:hypothetical protein
VSIQKHEHFLFEKYIQTEAMYLLRSGEMLEELFMQTQQYHFKLGGQVPTTQRL